MAAAPAPAPTATAPGVARGTGATGGAKYALSSFATLRPGGLAALVGGGTCRISDDILFAKSPACAFRAFRL